jgi:NAD(P)-dependent dehydrogenase (short-subunit alcohol dehydrogenase family)
MANFDKKVVVVTGGSSGIGAALVDEFLREGAHVAVLDIAAPVEDLPHQGAVYLACDVSNEASVESALERVSQDLGQIDIVVHSAAVLGVSGPFHELALETWQKYINTNLTGAFLVCRGAARRMIAAGVEGRIVLIGSVNSFAAERNAAPYASSKGGVRLLTRAAAVDLAQYGITVNMIAPGPITTAATQANFETDATKHVFARVLPGGKPGTPADVAAAVMFLASRESRFITGTDLLVDGGMFAQIMN